MDLKPRQERQTCVVRRRARSQCVTWPGTRATTRIQKMFDVNIDGPAAGAAPQRAITVGCFASGTVTSVAAKNPPSERPR